ncbi:MAG: hypothetical protein ACFFB0_06040 [Promethearchaeota archaeon]
MKNRKNRLELIFLIIFIFNLFLMPSFAVCIIKSSSTKSDELQHKWTQVWSGYKFAKMGRMVVDSSQNIFIAGETYIEESGDHDIFLVKLNESISELGTWIIGQNTTWGGNEAEMFTDMVLDSKDNIYIAGSTFSNGSKFSYLLKFNNEGILEWEQIWEGVEGFASCYGMTIDSSDNIYITGLIYGYDIFLVKYNKDGNQLWNRTWGKSGDDCVYSIITDSSNNVYLGGSTDFDDLLLKFSSSGDLLSNTTWKSLSFYDALVSDSLNNVYTIGKRCNEYNQNYCNITLVKFDTNGTRLWNVSCIETDILGGTLSLIIDDLNNLYLTGSEMLDQYEFDMFIMKFDSSGNLKWNRSLIGPNDEVSSSIIFDSSENLYIGGSDRGSKSDIFIVKYNNTGAQQWYFKWGEPIKAFSRSLQCVDLYTDFSGNYFVAGHNFSSGTTDYKMFLAKFTETPEKKGGLPAISGYSFLILIVIIVNSIIGLTYLINKKK